MLCERAEQPLSCSALEDTSAPAPMEIMMTGSPEDIYLFAARRAHVTRGSSGAAMRQKMGARAQVTCDGPGATPSRGDT
jgi:hypothetical protein